MRKKKSTKTLTKSETEIMNYLWDMKDGGTIRDILACYPEPKPAYTTIATFMKILTQKQYLKAIKRIGEGKTLYFYPTISRDEYRKRMMKDMKDNLFGGSSKELLSFFVNVEHLTIKDIEELTELIKKVEERIEIGK